MIFGPAVVDRDVVTLGKAKFSQPFQESGRLKRNRVARHRRQESDNRISLLLLRKRRERPHDCCATKNTEKFPPPHISPQA